jgi:flagellar biosynthesis/type III secretory pathway protein FliH
MKNNSVRELLNGAINVDLIKTPTGRAISTKMKNKFLNLEEKTKIKILAQIPQISLDTAKSIIEANIPLDEDLYRFMPNKVILGVKANKILKYIDMKK